MTVFERIETLRKSKHISQGKLEKELGFSNGSISKWKTSMPTPERLQKLANYFSVSIDYLLGDEEADRRNLVAGAKKAFDERYFNSIPTEFTDPDEARKYIGMHAIFGSEGFRLDKMDDEEVIRFANELLRQMELIAYKYKK